MQGVVVQTKRDIYQEACGWHRTDCLVNVYWPSPAPLLCPIRYSLYPEGKALVRAKPQETLKGSAAHPQVFPLTVITRFTAVFP